MADSCETRAFPGGRVAHPESQNEDKNEESLRKNYENLRKVELLPTWNSDVGYIPDGQC